MKKIRMLLVAVIGSLLASCATQKGNQSSAKTDIDTSRNSSGDKETINTNRKKSDVLGELAVLRFRPDSQVIVTKDYTCFFIYDRLHSCLFMTTDQKLYGKIREWLPEDVKGDSRNCVIIEGDMVDPFSYITKKELDENKTIEKFLLVNGLKVYSISSHVHYGDGIPQDVLDQIKNYPSNLKNNPQPPPAKLPGAKPPANDRKSNGRPAVHVN